MAYTLEEKFEELESAFMVHEELLELLITALMDEENLSDEAKKFVNQAYSLIYGVK